MELKIVKEDEKTLEVEVRGETVTLTNMLRETLWEDKNVSEAAHIKEHPYLAEPKIFVKVRRGNPRDALLKAYKRIVAQTEEFEEKFREALRK